MNTMDYLTAGGLLLDIFGALLIAIPDIPLISRTLTFGKLRTARERMETIGITRSDSGFKDLIEVLKGTDPIHEAEKKEKNTIQEVVVNQQTGVAASDIGFKWGGEYIEARYDEDGRWDTADYFELSDIYPQIRPKVAQGTTRLRVSGLLLLSSGFMLQLIPVLLS